MSNVEDSEYILRAKRVLEIEASGLAALNASLGDSFINAINILESISGRIVISGMGKSGHVGKKIAATLSSTGTPAIFVHPAEASHGDLGMIDESDAVIVISNSGQTPEMTDLVDYTKRFNIPLIIITAAKNSTISEQSDVTLLLPKVEEACPLGLAPTTTTTMAMALGDTLAIVLMDRIGFTAEDFKLRHPGGKLGKRLLKVSDIMHTGDAVPIALKTNLMSDVIINITSKSFGCIAIIDDKNKLSGIITDGDLRRNMSDAMLTRQAWEVMTPNPISIRPSALASEALMVMNTSQITNLFVAENNLVVGIIHIHDCLRAGVE